MSSILGNSEVQKNRDLKINMVLSVLFRHNLCRFLRKKLVFSILLRFFKSGWFNARNRHSSDESKNCKKLETSLKSKFLGLKFVN